MPFCMICFNFKLILSLIICSAQWKVTENFCEKLHFQDSVSKFIICNISTDVNSLSSFIISLRQTTIIQPAILGHFQYILAYTYA